MKALQNKIKILANFCIAGKYFKIVLEDLRIAKNSKAGQFVMLQVNEGCQPLLRRPFSMHNAHGSRIELLYEIVGIGTEILSRKKPGEYLDVIGPLGNGFAIRNMQYAILVGGGMGVAPLLFLAEKLKDRQMAKDEGRREILVLIGAKTKNQILCAGEFKQLGCEVKISTDDGSRGFKGKVTDLLRFLLSTMDYGLSTIYACGPTPMLKELALISSGHNIPAQASLEAHMACGFGACLGCVINTKQGLKKVCTDGPVFNPDEVIWQ